jgi:hypothetical protein
VWIAGRNLTLVIRNISARNITLRDTDGLIYVVPAYGTVSLDDALWDDTEFRRWVRYRVRDVAITTTIAGISPKEPVRVATTGSNITLSGLQTIDGVTVVLNDRVLVKDQTLPATNGIYTVKGGAWRRTADANEAADFIPNMFNFVSEGTINHDTGWVLATDAPIAVDATPLSWVQFTGPTYDIITQPSTSSRNTIQPVVDATALTLKNNSGTQTIDLAQWTDKNGVVEGRITNTGRVQSNDGLTTKAVSGVPADGSFTATPADGTLAVDTTNRQFYYRAGGTWNATSGAGMMASYLIYTNGTTYFAKSGASGAIAFSGTDPGAILNSCITALGTVGGLIQFADGTFTWTVTIPGLPRGITGKLHIRGSGNTTIVLVAGAPRFTDFNRIADNDTFQNIEISDFKIDCNNVGGHGHVIAGAYTATYNGLQRVNYDNITVRRVRAINLPVDSTTANHRIGFYPFTSHPGANEGTTNYVRNILCEDVRVEGGNIGFTVGGTGPSASIINIEYDNVQFIRCYHSLGVIPTVNYSSANFQVGVRSRAATNQGGSVPGSGRSVRMKDCFGEYSGDVAIEIDAPEDAVVDGCVMKDAFTNGYYSANNTPVTNVERQQWLWTNCTYIRRDVPTGRGFKATSSDGNACGRYVIRNCQVHRNEPTPEIGAVNGFQFSGSSTVPSYEEIDIDGFYCHMSGISFDGSGASAPVDQAIVINTWASSTVKTNVKLKDVRVRYNATRTTTGGTRSLFLTGIVLGGPMFLNIQGVDLDFQCSGIQSGGITGITLGAQAGSNIEGEIRNVRIPRTWTGDTTPTGISISGTATLTIPNSILIDNANLTLIPSAGTELAFAGVSNAAKVQLGLNNKWRLHPVSPRVATTTTTANYKDSIILADATSGAFQITLEDATQVFKGRMITIKRINTNANNVTIATTASQTIDGQPISTLTAPFDVISVLSDGTNWQVI